jgi:oxaloacetate decarboxylase beta subunit
LKKSVTISIIILILYFSLPLIPTENAIAAGLAGEPYKKKTVISSNFDDFQNWNPDHDLRTTNGQKFNNEDDLIFTINKFSEESYSVDNSAVFRFNNFTGYGGIWLEREFDIQRYTKYSIKFEYYGKLSNLTDPNASVKPIIYLGEKNPESFDDFKTDSNTLTQNWTRSSFKGEKRTGEDTKFWIAFGFEVEKRALTLEELVSGNISNHAINYSCYIDDVKITFTMTELTLEELVIQYLRLSIMFIIGLALIYLAIRKEYEPLLLLPIGLGIILANIPVVGMMEPGGILYLIYKGGIATGLFPLLIFLGIGSLTDFGPMLANPKTSLLGAAAQFGIFTTLIGALLLGFSLSEASSIGIIGGADGPTAIYLSINLAPHLLGPIAIAAYSYMALVPIIQPPIIKALTNKKERTVKMEQMRFVSQREKILFPIGVILICAFLLPEATPLVGMLMFGNLLRESGVVQRLANAAGNELINIVTIFLGLGVGATMIADTFLTFQTIAIILLGLAAFAVGTAMGVFFGKIMHKFSGGKVNPMIGAAGVSAVPMAARVVQKMGLSEDPNNHLLMHAMGPNVAGVLGSAVAAGVLLKLVGVG